MYYEAPKSKAKYERGRKDMQSRDDREKFGKLLF